MTAKKKTKKSATKVDIPAKAKATKGSGSNAKPTKEVRVSKASEPDKTVSGPDKTASKPAKAKEIKTPNVKATKIKKKATAAPQGPASKVGGEKTAKPGEVESKESAKVLESKVVYEGRLFRVLQDRLIEPGGRESNRDVIRHNGSVVILAVNPGKKKKDPWIVIERQYRHAAGQYLWELPAGKLDAGESAMDGAKRELSEETGYKAKKWSALVEYFASPGFLGESMKVFLAEGLIAGDAHPEEDETIDFRLVKLTEILDLIDKGKVIDGKTLTSVLLYARQLGIKRHR